MNETSGLSYTRACEILKPERVIGIEKAWSQFGLAPADEEMASLETIPLDEDFLRRMCPHACLLVALWPISLLRLRQVASTHFYNGPTIDSSWWLNEAFAKAEVPRAEWAVIFEDGTTTFVNETGRFHFLDETSAAVLAYTAILFTGATNGQVPMFRHPRRTSSLTDSGKPVYFQLMAGQVALF